MQLVCHKILDTNLICSVRDKKYKFNVKNVDGPKSN
jgi:hypothetical protein